MVCRTWNETRPTSDFASRRDTTCPQFWSKPSPSCRHGKACDCCTSAPPKVPQYSQPPVQPAAPISRLAESWSIQCPAQQGRSTPGTEKSYAQTSLAHSTVTLQSLKEGEHSPTQPRNWPQSRCQTGLPNPWKWPPLLWQSRIPATDPTTSRPWLLL